MMFVIGGVLGGLASMLSVLGNPPNMGLCVACFLRDTAGALGLHSTATVQYIRPEIPGLIMGSAIAAALTGEFSPRGGSSPLLRFFLAVFVVLGALVFMGCPLRMALRLAGGDLSALVGAGGFVTGIWAGVVFLRRGFTLGESRPQEAPGALVIHLFSMFLAAAVFVRPAFILSSAKGPGSMHAPSVVAVGIGLIAGVLVQRFRICMVGAVRDLILVGDFHLARGFAGLVTGSALVNIATGRFNPGINQPLAHSDAVFNFLGLALVGLGSVFLGGCPLRQLVLAGEGDADAGLTLLGLLVGAALAHNLGVAASAQGVPLNGKIAVVAGLVLVSIVGYVMREGMMGGNTRRT